MYSYSTLIRLNFNNSKLIAHHAQLQSEAYKAVKSSGKVSFREFAVTPKHNNVFEWMGEVAGIAMGTTLTDNANTGVIKYEYRSNPPKSILRFETLRRMKNLTKPGSCEIVQIGRR